MIKHFKRILSFEERKLRKGSLPLVFGGRLSMSRPLSSLPKDFSSAKIVKFQKSCSRFWWAIAYAKRCSRWSSVKAVFVAGLRQNRPALLRRRRTVHFEQFTCKTKSYKNNTLWWQNKFTTVLSSVTLRKNWTVGYDSRIRLKVDVNLYRSQNAIILVELY